MKKLSEQLTKKLDREWRLLDPDRNTAEYLSGQYTIEESVYEMRRIKIGRVDQPVG